MRSQCCFRLLAMALLALGLWVAGALPTVAQDNGTDSQATTPVSAADGDQTPTPTPPVSGEGGGGQIPPPPPTLPVSSTGGGTQTPTPPVSGAGDGGQTPTPTPTLPVSPEGGGGGQIPTPTPTPVPDQGGGTLTVNALVCAQTDDPVASVAQPVAAGEDAGNTGDEAMRPGCVPDNARFEVYANGDLTADPIATFDTRDGVATVPNLPPTTGDQPHFLLETESQVYFEIFIGEDATTPVTVLQPKSPDNSDAGPDDSSETPPSGDDAGDASGNGDAVVIALPETGQGSDHAGDTIVLLFGAMSVIALGSSISWYRRRVV